MDEKKPDAKQEMTGKQALFGCSALIAAVAFIAFAIWFVVVLMKVSGSYDPEAEMANRPVFRRLFNLYNSIPRPSFAPRREFIMPDGSKKRPDGTWTAPTKKMPTADENSP